jgi:pyridoxine kinase
MLHKTHRVPHIVITSVRFSEDSKTVSVVGSTMRQDASPRLFKIEAPEIDCFFSGTGDMFAALALVRFRESIIDAGLEHVKSWVSPDDVEATSLPLAEAVEKVMGSMQGILQRTKVDRDVALEGLKGTMSQEEGSEKRLWLRQTKASEVRLVRNQDLLRHPDMQFKAEELSS